MGGLVIISSMCQSVNIYSCIWCTFGISDYDFISKDKFMQAQRMPWFSGSASEKEEDIISSRKKKDEMEVRK